MKSVSRSDKQPSEGGATYLQGRSGCPCCSFDLFLPKSYLQDEGSRRQEVESSTTLTTARSLIDFPGNEALDCPLGPTQALHQLVRLRTPLLVDTHGHPQLERDRDEIYDMKGMECGDGPHLKAIVCAVEPADWKTTLDFASTSDRYLPALGIHPWYLGNGLTENWLAELEVLLLDHPSAIVGEIGLCKMARWTRQYELGKAAALEIQRQVFKQQMQLAARLRRPVSVHCVNQHGALISVLKDLMEGGTNLDCRSSLPPAIGMHSFTGTAHQAKELLKIEEDFMSGKPNTSPIFFFGFSQSVNCVMTTSEKARRKGREAVRSIPADRLLVESDVHASKDLLGGTAGAIAYVAWARDEELSHTAKLTSDNGIAFLASR